MQSVRLPGCRMWSATFHLDGLCRQTERIVLGSTHIVEGCIVDVRDMVVMNKGVLSFSVSLPSFAAIIMSFTFW